MANHTRLSSQSGVTAVTAVITCAINRLSVTPAPLRHVTSVTPAAGPVISVTPVTPRNGRDVIRKIPPLLGCTPVTPVTPKMAIAVEVSRENL